MPNLLVMQHVIQPSKANLTATLLAMLLGSAGCGASSAQSNGRAMPAPTTTTTARSAPYVPRGTEFMVDVETPIQSNRSQPGEPITLRLIQPLRSTDPNVVVPAGAVIDGEVVGVDPGYLPDIRIALKRIHTPYGTAPLHAGLRYAGQTAWVNPHALYDPETLGYDSILYHPFYRPNRAVGGAVGGGPPPALDEPIEPIRLPAGSEVELVLMRPLVLPTK